jgi:hypothetical protein
MTENEAKTKWCPMVRHVQFFNDIEDNRGLFEPRDNPLANACIGSLCMMWRWTFTREEASNGHGHCGLASRP